MIDQQELIDAMNNPEQYCNLTIRVSGYAVHLTNNREQQQEVIARSFHQVWAA